MVKMRRGPKLTALAGLLLASVSVPAAAQVRLVSYGPASANADAFALTVADEQYDPCIDADPADPANPPPAFFAECEAAGTDIEGRAANSSSFASVTLSTTPAGVDGQGNPLISGLTLAATSNATAFGAANEFGQTANASGRTGCSATLALSAVAGTPITAAVDVSGLPGVGNDPCTVSSVPPVFPGSGTLTVTVDCPDAQSDEDGPTNVQRSITVALTFGAPAGGACCAGDGSCSETTESACAAAGGAFEGAATTCAAACGDELAWIDPLGGLWVDIGNWDLARVPVAADRVRFELASAFGVELGGARSARGARVRASLLDLADGTLDLAGTAPALTIGDGARLRLTTATVRPNGVVIGDVALAPASTLAVAAGGTLDAAGTFRIGDLASGILDVTGGDATLGETIVGGPEEAGPALTLPRAGMLPGTPPAQTLPELAGGKIRVNGGGGATFASLAIGGAGPGFVDVRQGSLVRVLGETRLGEVPGPGWAAVGGQVGDAFATWQSQGPLLIGTVAEGNFDVLAGGHMTAPSLDLGVEPGGDGTLTVAGAGALATIADRLSVGNLGVGTLTVIEARVDVGELRAARASDAEARITVQGFAGSLRATDTIAIGIPGAARLEINDQADVRARALAVAFFQPNEPSLTPSVVDADRGFLFVTDEVTIGNIDETTGTAGGLGLVTLAGGSRLFATSPTSTVTLANGELIVRGKDAGGIASSLETNELEVLSGTVAVRDGARTTIDRAFVVGAPGAEPVLEVNESTAGITTSLDVGDESDVGRRGRVQLVGAARIEVGSELFVGPGGVIAGTGVIRVGPVDVEVAGGTLTNLGLIAPGSSPGTIAVEGDLVQGPAGTLVVEIGGTAAGSFDVLTVSGDVKLAGTLVLRFLDGYLPQPGDVVRFLSGKKVKGAFDAVRVEGVGPGFDFTLASATGTLTALTAAVPPACADAADADADGVTCADNCPAIANATQADGDADQLGDACDPCTDGAPLQKPVLTLKAGKLALKGTLSLPGAPLLNPTTSGARVVLLDGSGATVATLDAPPGAFDPATKAGWKKLAFSTKTSALRALKLAQGKKALATVKLAVKAVLTGVDPATLVPPLTARVLLDPATVPSGLCGEVRFTGPPAVHPLCEVKGGALGCKLTKKR